MRRFPTCSSNILHAILHYIIWPYKINVVALQTSMGQVMQGCTMPQHFLCESILALSIASSSHLNVLDIRPACHHSTNLIGKLGLRASIMLYKGQIWVLISLMMYSIAPNK